ncbi:MAG: hypothetical protein ACXQS2_01130 [Methermicoccaceae archaeon]
MKHTVGLLKEEEKQLHEPIAFGVAMVCFRKLKWKEIVSCFYGKEECGKNLFGYINRVVYWWYVDNALVYTLLPS